MKKLEIQLPDDFLKSSSISDTKQKEIALTIREVLAKNFGLPVNKVHSSAEPNQILKWAKKDWDDVDFLIDIEEILGVNYVPLIEKQLDSLFTGKFFGFILKHGVKNIGEWINVTSLLCLKNSSREIDGIVYKNEFS
ncbi:MAG: hypothetical protein LBU34_06670 [Planctomycetaceae bacterium]|jgi:hypothetical protein|nr:hypothetical protein [Planctomycetaceae bacterium]